MKLLFILTLALAITSIHSFTWYDPRTWFGGDVPAIIESCDYPDITGNFSSDIDIDSPEYIALSAEDKAKLVLELMENSEYSTFPNNWVDILKGNWEIGLTALNKTISETFDRYSDAYMANHEKVIHTHGTIATIAIVPKETSLNVGGLFKGAPYGLIRMSIVKDPNAPCAGIPGTEGCFAPGIALKSFRNGTYSGNLIAMNALGDGQLRDFNFFKKSMK